MLVECVVVRGRLHKVSVLEVCGLVYRTLCSCFTSMCCVRKSVERADEEQQLDPPTVCGRGCTISKVCCMYVEWSVALLS